MSCLQKQNSISHPPLTPTNYCCWIYSRTRVSFFISTNSGFSWFAANVTNHWWSSVAMSADGRKLVALGEVPEEIITSTNFGASWTTQPGAPTLANPNEWGPVASSADGVKLIAAPYNGGLLFT